MNWRWAAINRPLPWLEGLFLSCTLIKLTPIMVSPNALTISKGVLLAVGSEIGVSYSAEHLHMREKPLSVFLDMRGEVDAKRDA